jgi:hypothetical protein
MSETKALDIYIKNNGMCPIDAQGRDEYRTGLGYFVEGWDEHERQAAAELSDHDAANALLRKQLDEAIDILEMVEKYTDGLLQEDAAAFLNRMKK